ncbi:MAG: glycosyltransferase family 4 protein [Porphyrobacter sp.]|nr:glycosyltransferase family 4 protein [Porphyrobacter sp.]
MPSHHISILTSGLGAGGAERVIAQLAAHWCDTPYRLSIITFDHAEDAVFHPLPSNVKIERLGDASGSGLLSAIRKTFVLRKALRRDPPDLLISFLTKNNLLAALASIGLPTGLVCCERNNPERQKVHPLWNFLLPVAYRRADAIVCQTEGVKRCFPHSAADKLVVIPNPFARIDRTESAAAGKNVCAVGRLTDQKGFDVLIEAFSRALPGFPGWKLHIWGSGSDLPALVEQISDLGLSESVYMRGISPLPGSWLDYADLFVLSSRYEGFPNALGEAMAAGLPIVATTCDFGPEEMLEHGESGWLVRNEDPAALADGLKHLMSDASLRARLGSGAAKAVQRYAPAVVFRQWDNLVRDLLGPKEETAKVSAGSTHSREVRVTE